MSLVVRVKAFLSAAEVKPFLEIPETANNTSEINMFATISSHSK